MVAVAHGAGAQRRRVGAGARLGQAVARDQLHGAELRQPVLALGVAAVGIDHPGRHVVDRDEGRHGRAARRQRLEDQRRVEPRQAGAADILADVDAAHAERRGLAHHVDRKMLVLVPAQRVRRDLLRRKRQRHVANRDLILVESELHVVGVPHSSRHCRSEATKQSSLPSHAGIVDRLRCLAMTGGATALSSSSSGSRTPRLP